MRYYIDTSLLLKRYLPEVGSAQLEDRLISEQPELVVSALVQVEFVSAIRRKERSGTIDRSIGNAVHARFLADAYAGAIRLLDFDSSVLQKAQTLLMELPAPLAHEGELRQQFV